MRIGLIVNTPVAQQSFEKTLEGAVAKFYRQFGKYPNKCYVHPSVDFKRINIGDCQIEIVQSQFISQNQMWIGINGRNETDIEKMFI